LTNQRDITTSLQRFHERLGSRTGDGSQVVHQICLCHSNTSIAQDQTLLILQGKDLNLQSRLALQSALIGQRSETNLIQSVRRIGDQLAQEHFLVRVESVDDQAHQLIDLSLELEGLNSHFVFESRKDESGSKGRAGSGFERAARKKSLNQVCHSYSAP
jgi:hypothetical protein